MRVLLIYDSVYGNTEKIAKAIGDAIEGETTVARAGQLDLSGLETIHMLVVGSPTLGGRPTESVQDFLAKAPEASVRGVKVAAFDTRYSGRFVKMFGFAAEKIIEGLSSKGGVPVSPPEPFYVKGKKGPLKEGELERAASWGKEISKRCQG